MSEQWKNIIGNSQYQISNLGRVRRIATHKGKKVYVPKKVLKTRNPNVHLPRIRKYQVEDKNEFGFNLDLNEYKDVKHAKGHRIALVEARAFIDPMAYKIVYKDGNSRNVKLSNLGVIESLKNVPVEHWKLIPGYNIKKPGFSKCYISDLGRLLINGNLSLVGHGNVKHRSRVQLYRNNKRDTWSVAILVAMMFLPNPKHLAQLKHKNGDLQDNCVRNLEWVRHNGDDKVKADMKNPLHRKLIKKLVLKDYSNDNVQTHSTHSITHANKVSHAQPKSNQKIQKSAHATKDSAANSAATTSNAATEAKFENSATSTSASYSADFRAKEHSRARTLAKDTNMSQSADDQKKPGFFKRLKNHLKKLF